MKIHQLLLLISILLTTGCGGSRDKSPQFAPGSSVKVSGRFLQEDGSPLSGKKIQLQNPQKFAYIDYSSPDVNAIGRDFFGVSADIFSIFFPFFPRWRYADDYYKEVYVRPGFFQQEITTDGEGGFSFSIKAENFLRDAEGGININVTNEKIETDTFGRAAFVVKKQDTDLGDIRLCSSPVLVKEETDQTISFTFSAPSFEAQQYIVNFGDVETSDLIWSEVLAAGTTSINLPQAVFGSRRVRVAYEAFAVSESEKKISCLVPATEFSLSTPSSSLIAGAVASSPTVLFRIDSLTNSAYDDSLFFEALAVRSVRFDLAPAVTASRILLHNFVSDGNAVLTIDTGDGPAFQVASKRFQQIEIGRSSTMNYLEISSDAPIVDLKEISLF